MTRIISRRDILRRTAFITAGAAVGSQLLGTPGYAASKNPDPNVVREAIQKAQNRSERVLTGIPSKNGWEMEKVVDDHGNIYTRPVPGTPLDGVAMRMGDIETVLVHLVCRFHYEIDELRKGDVVGWRSPGSVRKGLPESNLASGTAVAIRSGGYPLGVRGGFFPHQEAVVRDILAECEGVIRWGGDDKTPHEALFYIDVPPGNPQLAKVADKFRSWNYTPGRAGVLIDPHQPGRRKAAQDLLRRQRP
ncbi:hypothetical protein [Streptomyces blastmyceticus]|uniref:Twin-arginine translocation signal domain-containing protein n=1 Tax=Streptomyces blastmyceticus TaxID=68180 RepID=A0ABP3HRU7_9ACTN